MTSTLKRKLARVRLFLCDVDGVLTDGTVWMGGGAEAKRFHIRDGLGLRILMRHGVRVGWISRRPSEATRLRAKDLRIDYLYQSDEDKVAAAAGMMRRAGVGWEEVCYMGDDIVDLSLLERVGVAVVVRDASPEPRRVADYVTRLGGGRGAVREVVELILKAQGKWRRVLDEYTS